MKMEPEKVEAKIKKQYESPAMDVVLLHYEKSLLEISNTMLGSHETEVKKYTA